MTGGTGPVERVRTAVEEVVSRARAETRALADELAEQRTTAARRRTEHEAAARRGDLGPDAQLLQEAVDRRATTWEAVLDGRDPSPAADRARAHVVRRLEELRGRDETGSERNPGEGAPS